MSEKKDTFWKLFLTSIVFVVVVFVAYALVALLLQGGTSTSRVPSFFDFSFGDEYVAQALAAHIATTSPFLYRDAIPLGADNASWDTVVSWQSPQHVFEGSRAVRAEFLRDGSGVALEGMVRATAPYDGITLAVFPEHLGTTTLSLALYDTRGHTIGAEPLAWYVDQPQLTEGLWQEVAIPFANIATTSLPSFIGGFAIEASGSGVVYIDFVRLTANTAAHTRWEPPPAPLEEYADPLIALFVHTPQVSLPYDLNFSLGTTSPWYTLWGGRFSLMSSYINVAPPEEGTDGMFAFLSGRDWVNYQVDAVLDWGSSQTFGLLVRFVDDAHFATCNFSAFGASVQLSAVINGKSQLVGETPQLPVPDIGGWNDVSVGVLVKNNQVTCLLNGEAVLTGTVPALPKSGTVGIEVWDSAPYRVPHHLRMLHVEAVP